MSNKPTAYRMYFFVPYHLSGIQKGIQVAHCALEYASIFHDSEEFLEYHANHKTMIVLNGGTTNSAIGEGRGSLNLILDDLYDSGIPVASFSEPDLNGAITCVCFLADNRVWDWESYPDFKSFLLDTVTANGSPIDVLYKINTAPSSDDLECEFRDEYTRWLRLVGGRQNAFLKNLIFGKSLA